MVMSWSGLANVIKAGGTIRVKARDYSWSELVHVTRAGHGRLIVEDDGSMSWSELVAIAKAGADVEISPNRSWTEAEAIARAKFPR